MFNFSKSLTLYSICCFNTTSLWPNTLGSQLANSMIDVLDLGKKDWYNCIQEKSWSKIFMLGMHWNEHNCIKITYISYKIISYCGFSTMHL